MNRNQYIATILLAFTSLISSAEMSPREIKAEFQLMVPPQFQRALPPNLIKIEIEKIKSIKEELLKELKEVQNDKDFTSCMILRAKINGLDIALNIIES